MANKDRTAEVARKTGETDIAATVDLDGSGRADIATGIGFFDHMLTLLARHSLIDLTVKATGDLEVDAHHTVEDVGIVLGQAIDQALGDRAGITRYGAAAVPMDEALARAVIDLGGRPYLVYDARFPADQVGEFDIELIREFLIALANNVKMNAHLHVPYGANVHHIAEAIFKSLARALRQAVEPDARASGIPSTKGTL
ncbi:MAG: imidazoleglycerol-phosphate dehydratase HisB [Anaerolineaceae bacterium]|nr:imidazoleglycerol-phosphate dehydratase HisB [Anaerolineaceae bacterium]